MSLEMTGSKKRYGGQVGPDFGPNFNLLTVSSWKLSIFRNPWSVSQDRLSGYA